MRSLFLLAAPLLAATSAIMVSAASPPGLVIQVGATCMPACGIIKTVFSPDCANCIIGAGWIPAWSNTTAPLLRRMPLYEFGLTNLPALPFVYPSTAVIDRLVGTAWNAQTQYGHLPDNITICKNQSSGPPVCVTRNMGPKEYLINASGPCYLDDGWVKIAPKCDGSPDPLANITFQTPEQLASMFVSDRNISGYMPTAQAYAQKVYTDADASADSLWRMNQVAWSWAQFFRAASEADLPELEASFGSDWQGEWTMKVKAGNMTIWNLTWVTRSKLNYGQNATSTFQAWPLAICERMMNQEGQLVNRVRAILLTDPQGKRESTVYTPQKSVTAFILAMNFARGALAASHIWLGHFFSMHSWSGAYGYAHFNLIDRDVPMYQSTNPLRQLLDQYMDPTIKSTVELFLWNGLLIPPNTAISGPYLLHFFNDYVTEGPLGKGNYFLQHHPLKLIQDSNLKVEDYTSPGGKPWDMYDAYRFRSETFAIVKDYAKQIVDVYWPNNKAVRQDTDIQSIVTFLLDPLGGNFQQLNQYNKITTKGELTDFLAHLIAINMAQSMFHLQDYSLDSFYNFAVFTDRTFTETFHDPTGNFTMEDIMAMSPGADAVGKMALIGLVINANDPMTTPWITMNPDGSPNWEAFPRFSNNGTKGPKANAIHSAFKKQLLEYMRDYPVNSMGVRDAMTNYDWPFQFAPSIDV